LDESHLVVCLECFVVFAIHSNGRAVLGRKNQRKIFVV
jgi:hypothetical protein